MQSVPQRCREPPNDLFAGRTGWPEAARSHDSLMVDHVSDMLKVNIADAKAHLSSYLGRVAQGETIVLCRRNVPVAEIRPLAQRRTEKRPVGTDPGLVVPDSFFEPLPDDLLRAFEGGAADEPDETGGRLETDPVVQLRRQREARLEAFFAQKKHLSFRDEAPRSLNEVTARLQSPLAVDRTALATAAERLQLSNPR